MNIAVVVIYLCVLLTCTLYSIILAWMQRHPRWNYAPDWTWLTVVIGDGILFIGIAFLFIHDVASIWTVGGIFPIGGVPIIVWQLHDTWQRRCELAAYQRKKE
jgi:TRAP-type C4-dicarboxylate transport system permease small subunit